MQNLFPKSEIDRRDQAQKRDHVVQPEGLGAENQQGENRKYAQRDNFLYDLKLDQRERTAVSGKTDAVCGYLEAVFKEGDPPTYNDNKYERYGASAFRRIEFQVAVPGDGHKNVGHQQKSDRVQSFHIEVCR